MFLSRVAHAPSPGANSRVYGERREMEKGELQVSARMESVVVLRLKAVVTRELEWCLASKLFGVC